MPDGSERASEKVLVTHDAMPENGELLFTLSQRLPTIDIPFALDFLSRVCRFSACLGLALSNLDRMAYGINFSDL
jgi:hypothetical protein